MSLSVLAIGSTVGLWGQTGMPPAAVANVSLSVSIRARNSDQLRELKPSDMVVTDAGRMVDSREMRVSFMPVERAPLLTFIFDRMPQAGTRAATRSAEEMLTACVGRATLAGMSESVWAIDTRLRIVQAYTDDTSAVRKAMAQVRANAGKPGTSAMDAGEVPPQTDMAGTSLTAAAQVVAERRAPWSYAAILAAARTQRQRPGRKAIVLFTGQTAFDVNAPDRYRELQQALKDARVALYVVDVNTLDAGESQQLLASSAMGGQAASNYYAGLATLHSTAPLATTMGMGAMQFQAMKDTITNIEMGNGQQEGNPLAQAARASGGVYSFVDASAKKLGQEMMAELSSYVTVSYTIPADQQDGRYHAVSVKPLKPGMSGGTQPGYFAVQGTDDAGAGLLRRTGDAMADATMEGDPALLEKDAVAADFRFRAAVLRFGRASDGLRAAVAVEVPVGGLRLQEDEHTRLFSLHATVCAELTDAAGKTVARFQEEYRRRGAMGSEKELAGEVLSLARPMSLAPGVYTVRVTVRDWNAATWNRRTQPVEVSEADGDAALSDLLVVRGTQAAPGGAEPVAIQYGEQRVVPNLSGELNGESEKVSLYFQLYAARVPSTLPATPKSPSKLTLAVTEDGQPVATMPLQMGETQPDGMSTHVFTVPLQRGAGRYEMTVRLEQGKEIVERRASVIVAESPVVKDAANIGAMAMEAGLVTVSTRELPATESAALIEATRENALKYTERLPNFICLETIARTADHAGTGAWKMRDTIVESLQYRDKVELRTVMRVNGEKSSLAADHVEGARSNGEFGSLLRAIFDPEAKAEFTWAKKEEANGERLEVYRFRVAEPGSQFTVTDRTNSRLRAAFHGFVFVDGATRTVRRLYMQTDGLPRDFGVRSSWIAMNYDYVAINEHDYLLPSRGEVGLQQGKHEVLLNEVAFSGYRRFGSKTRVMAAGGEDQP